MRGKDKRSVQLHILLSGQEAGLIRERMAQAGVTNMSAYVRKMAIDGYIIHLDLTDVQELTKLLRACSNNLNQYARRANETGSVYAADVEDLRARLDGLWDVVGKVLLGLSQMP